MDKTKIIQQVSWNMLYKEMTEGLDPYDQYYMGFVDAMDRVDDWMDAQPEAPAVPGHTDQYNIAEMSYNNGYAKGCEDNKKEYEALKTELMFTRRFINHHGLEFALASAWEKAGHSGSAVEKKRGHWVIHSRGLRTWGECSECHVCGSPQWKVCPVCESRMDIVKTNNFDPDDFLGEYEEENL